MANARKLRVEILGDSKGMQGAIDEADGHLAGFGKKAGVALAAGAAGAAVGVGLFLKSAVEAAEESRKVTAQTDAVIKSTGGTANVSTKDVDHLATRLSNLTGVDDELIASNSNLLLTFTNVKNEIGEGNDVFDQANKTILDMSVALGQDGKSSAIQLGKALNDPIKGITALSKVGVTFTDQQKDQIKAMVESGDTMGAQKAILAELNKEFGGSAEAAASPMAKLKVAFGNIQESVGGLLLPALGKAATGVAGFLSNLQSGASEGQRHGHDLATNIGTSFKVLVGSFKNADDGVTSSGFFGTLERIGIGARKVVDTIRENWPQIKATVVDVVKAVVGFVETNWPVIQRVISETLETVTAIIKGAATLVMTIWENFGSQITDVIAVAWKLVSGTIENAMKVIQGVIKVITGIIKGDWGEVWDGVKGIFGAVWDEIQTILSAALGIIKSVLSAAWELIKGVAAGAWDGIKGVFSGAFDGIVGLVRTGVANIVDIWLGMAESILGAADWAFGWIPFLSGPLDTAKRKFAEFRDSVNASIRGIDSEKTITVTVREIAAFTGIHNPLKRAGGGIVPGIGNRDSVHALLTPGEFVLNKDAVGRVGIGTLRQINAMANGGLIGGDGGFAPAGARGGGASQLTVRLDLGGGVLVISEAGVDSLARRLGPSIVSELERESLRRGGLNF